MARPKIPQTAKPAKQQSTLINRTVNQAPIKGGLAGAQIEALNRVLPGLGLEIHTQLTTLAKAHTAHSGQAGPVGIAKQKDRAAGSRGLTPPGLILSQDRIAGVQDPMDDMDATNLRTTRRIAAYAAQEALNKNPTTSGGGPGGGTPGSGGTPGKKGSGGTDGKDGTGACSQTAGTLTQPNTLATALAVIYAVQV